MHTAILVSLGCFLLALTLAALGYKIYNDKKSVDGGWSRWSAYSECSVPCGGGTKERTRTCTNPSPKNGGKECVGDDTETAVCNQQPCPASKQTSSESAQQPAATQTSTPSAVPGSSTTSSQQPTSSTATTATPASNSMSTSDTGSPTTTSGTASITTTTTTPASSTVPVSAPESTSTQQPTVWANGGWSDWSVDGVCDRPCGVGSQREKRTCLKPNGTGCEGPDTRQVQCNVHACPIDGGLTGWQDATTCSKTCGGGVKTLTRSCTAPVPQNGGKGCPETEPLTKTVACNEEPCPIAGGWSNWINDPTSTCSKTCGGGTIQQKRYCNAPAPQHGGAACVGSDTQITDCNTQPCPIDGGWTGWMDSGTCSKPCEGGEMLQVRTCTNPTPQHQGKDCVGPTTQTVPCNTGSCSWKLQNQRSPELCLYAASMGTATDLNSRTRWKPCATPDDLPAYWQFQPVGTDPSVFMLHNKGFNGCLKRPVNSTKVPVVPCNAADTYQHWKLNLDGTMRNQGVLSSDTYPNYASLVNRSYARPPEVGITTLDVWTNDSNAERFAKTQPKLLT